MDQSITLTPYNLATEPLNGANYFAQTFMYKPPQGELHRKRGELFALLSVTNLETTVNKSQFSKQVFDHLQQEYFGEERGSAFEALENAARSAIQHGQKLAENSATQVELVTIAVWGKSFHFFRTPNSYLGLVQNGELLGLDQHELGTESFNNGNQIVLATPLFTKRIFKPLMQESTQTLLLAEQLPKLREKLLALNEENPAAALIVDINIAEIPAEEEVIEIEIAENHDRSAKSRLNLTPLLKRLGPKRLTQIFNFSAKGGSASGGQIPIFNRGKEKLPEIYLKPRFPESKRGRLVVALLLVGLLGASALITHKVNQRQERLQQAREVVKTSGERIKKARELAALNPAQAQRELKGAENQLGSVLGTSDEIDKKARELQGSLREATQEIYKTQTVTARAVQPADELNSQSLTVDEIRGILNRRGEALLTRVDEWQTPAAVEEYFNNLYVLDNSANQIHKYIGIPSGYSTRRDYFKHSVDLNGAVNIAIDGSIYVLYRDGRVLKFTAGEREEFSLSDFRPPLEGAKLIKTSAEAKHLYITKDSTVMIFNKNGQYQRQLEVENLETIDDLALDSNESILYLLSNQQWYQASL